MCVFVQAQSIKTAHAGGRGGVKKWQNSVHVVVECPPPSPQGKNCVSRNHDIGNRIMWELADMLFWELF